MDPARWKFFAGSFINERRQIWDVNLGYICKLVSPKKKKKNPGKNWGKVEMFQIKVLGFFIVKCFFPLIYIYLILKRKENNLSILFH